MSTVAETHSPAPEHTISDDERLDYREILDRARKAVPALRERAGEIERNRRLPSDVVELLRTTGVFRMAAPASWGGPEMTSAQQTEVIETIATGDASAAWCAMIGADSGIFSGYLDGPAARSLFTRLDTITAGFINPTGRAERVPGGYRVSGKWHFGSGITHSDLLLAGCLVHDGGRPEAAPDGDPVHWRIVIARREDFTVHDNWYTTGLAGSGSCDYSTEGLFVPEEHTFSLSDPRRPGTLHAAPDAILRTMSGVPLGVARAALDYVRELAATRTDKATGTPWSEQYRFTAAIAEAEMELSAARHFVYTGLEEQWARLEEGREPTPDERAATALARYKAFDTARSVVNRMFSLAGGSSIYRNASPMDRWLRDVITMSQHVDAGPQNLKAAGELLLGGQVPQKTLLW